MNQKNTTEVLSPHLLRTCLEFALNFSDYFFVTLVCSAVKGDNTVTHFLVRIKWDFVGKLPRTVSAVDEDSGRCLGDGWRKGETSFDPFLEIPAQ